MQHYTIHRVGVQARKRHWISAGDLLNASAIARLTLASSRVMRASFQHTGAQHSTLASLTSLTGVAKRRQPLALTSRDSILRGTTPQTRRVSHNSARYPHTTRYAPCYTRCSADVPRDIMRGIMRAA